jgi:hypothetical protein
MSKLQDKILFPFSGFTYKLFRSEVSSEDGGIMFHRNAAIYVQVYTSLQPKRPTSSFSPM